MEPHPYPAAPPATERLPSLGCFSWRPAAVLIIIMGYSGMAVYRLKDEAATVASVTASFWIFLALLLCCLLLLNEITAAESAWRDRLKGFVCALATFLYLHVAYIAMGAAALTLRVALLVWFIPAAGWAGYFFFNRGGRVYQQSDETLLLPPV